MASPIMMLAGGGVSMIAKGSITTGVRHVAQIRFADLYDKNTGTYGGWLRNSERKYGYKFQKHGQ